MSKIGKKNITVPKESSVKIEGSNLLITGPKGSKSLTIDDKISKLQEAIKVLKKEKTNLSANILDFMTNHDIEDLNTHIQEVFESRKHELDLKVKEMRFTLKYNFTKIHNCHLGTQFSNIINDMGR